MTEALTVNIHPKYQVLWHNKSRYYDWYVSLCESRRVLNRVKGDGNYYESHHIIPKWLGGKNHLSNLVLFTAREHYLAHYFLFLHLKDRSSSAAFHIMNKSVNNEYRDSRKYEEVRKFQSVIISGENNPAKNKNTRMKISFAVSGEKNGMFGRTGKLNPFYNKTHSDEFIERKKMLHGIKTTFNGVEYLSLRDAERKTGVSRFLIKKAICQYL